MIIFIILFLNNFNCYIISTFNKFFYIKWIVKVTSRANSNEGKGKIHKVETLYANVAKVTSHMQLHILMLKTSMAGITSTWPTSRNLIGRSLKEEDQNKRKSSQLQHKHKNFLLLSKLSYKFMNHCRKPITLLELF